MTNDTFRSASPNTGRRIRLLLVEDNPGDADLIRESLPRGGAGGFDVTVKERLKDTLTLLKDQDFDLILLDLGLPDSEGMDTVRAVIGERPDTPVVVMTGNDDRETGLSAVREGAQDFLVKGAVPGFLLDRIIQYAIERHQAQAYFKESERFLRASLDALSANIAILDEEGRILAVNHAWKAFGQANGAIADRISEGMDYLEICDAVKTSDQKEAAAFAAGIRAVLTGGREYFELEYPCHGPLEKRWFIGKVTPFPGGKPRRVVIAHENITPRKMADQALRESNQRLDEAQRIARIGHWEWDVATGNVIWSNETYRLFGLAPGDAEPTYELVMSFIHPDDVERWRQGLKEAMTAGNRIIFEYRAVRSDGEEIWIQNQAEILRDASGNVLKFTGTAQDVTERKQGEESLRSSEERLRLVLDASPNCVFIKDFEGRYLLANKAMAKLFNTPQSDIIGKRDTELAALRRVGPNDAENFITDDQAVIRLKQTMVIPEEPFTRADGTVRWFHTIKTPIDLPGNPGCLLGIAVDITEQKLNREALRNSELRFRTILDSLTNVVFLIDNELNIVWPNRATCETAGKSRKVLQGRRCREVWPDAADACPACPVEAAMKTGKLRMETFQRSDGKTWRVMGIPVKDESGKIVSAVEVAENITEQISIEEQFRQSQKMEAIGRLAGGVAHDFNNMLSIIIGYGELVRAGIDEKNPFYQDVEEILDAAQRSTGLVKQLLAFSRQQIIEPRIVDLNQAIENSHKMLRRLVGEDIQVTFKPSTDLWPVMIDPVQVDQIMANLSVNSRDAIDGTGLIGIETRNVVLDSDSYHYGVTCPPGEYILLAFSDSGSGMDKTTVVRIFEPFFTTKEEGKGTGLGLSTIFGIVQQNSGGVSVQSEPGEGTTFKIFFPRYIGDQQVSSPMDTENALRGDGAVLIVEDEGQVLKMTRKILDELGYTVYTAGTPGEAIEFCESHPETIDLLLTDVIMPKMNGRELEGHIKRLKPGIKTLFMSGYTADVIANRGVLVEGINFIQKPFNRKEISSKIHHILND